MTAWIVGGFCASALFVFAEALELAIVQPFEERWVTENREATPIRDVGGGRCATLLATGAIRAGGLPREARRTPAG